MNDDKVPESSNLVTLLELFQSFVKVEVGVESNEELSDRITVVIGLLRDNLRGSEEQRKQNKKHWLSHLDKLLERWAAAHVSDDSGDKVAKKVRASGLNGVQIPGGGG